MKPPAFPKRPETGRVFSAQIDHEWEAARPKWEAALKTGAATPFQHGAILDAWYQAMADGPHVRPLIITVREASSGIHALSLALVRLESGLLDHDRPLRTIAFADLGLIDYNAPIIGPAAPRSKAEAAALWRAIRRALPPADLLDLRKMPRIVGGIDNPLAPFATYACVLAGNVIHTGDDWKAYHFSLKKTNRKELERSWRVFNRHPEAAFVVIDEPAERDRVLAEIERQQPLRMQATGKDYRLDAPNRAVFYRRLIALPPAETSVVMTALTAGDEVVAALVGLRDAEDYIMIRISNREGEWAKASPGKLIIARTMEWLHAEGYRRFDLSIGDYDYKRRFNVAPLPLIDIIRPLHWRGARAASLMRAKARLRRYPAVRSLLKSWLKSPSRQKVSRDECMETAPNRD